MQPFPWLPGEEERVLLEADALESLPAMYTGPPPAPPTAPAATPPTMAALGAAIHNSADKLFFIAHSVDSTSRREWRLVRVNYSTSISLHPACLPAGRTLPRGLLHRPHC